MVSIVAWSRIRSPWILYMCTGACNACDIEVLAALAPKYDVERFGILLKGSPRHADALVVTGAVTRQVAPRLIRIYEQMPDPKFVIAAGTCAISGGVYWGCYNVLGGIDKVIPVSMYIPGCPVRPEAVIDGVAKLIAKLKSG
ncbi:MAG: NADH-quinone oxidoreductase subunit NuoB [Candidatus Methanomethylicia archaeon]|nr:NADH-quinone oxidoreductase subunit NuoB [Candidatus Methanomethylicia archaeon]MCX8168863.1 NADH-quinone oxidoreductase subunit NuoB [Candidatus Methanomethylicia archaeon]MDW7988595.1 NADH-quinone oxidoreductase subunit NuoB [Nitrososphaerota archaeon]